MAHFYGTISQSARKTTPTARGHKNTGLQTIAASWAGAIKVTLEHSAQHGRDFYSVALIDWPSGKTRSVLAQGWLDEADPLFAASLVKEAAEAVA